MRGDMNEEALFAKTLEQVRKTARDQGNLISEEQVREAFSALKLEDAQLEMVYDYLRARKVGIGTPADPEDDLSDKEKNYLQNYLEQLAQLPSYSPGEKEAFTLSAMAGEKDARGKLIEIYLKDVVDIARLYTGQGVYLEDLIGEGNMALTLGVTLLGSAESQEEADGFLGRIIMEAMEEHIRENSDSADIHKRVRNRVNRVFLSARELSEELHRKVTVEELAQESGLSEKQIRDAVRFCGSQIEYLEL